MEKYMVPVHAQIPAAQFRTLRLAAESSGVEVGAIVAELVRRGLSKSSRPSRSMYTSEMGAQMLEMRELNRSHIEIAAQFNVVPQTVNRFLKRAEFERRTRLANEQKAAS